MKRAQVSIDLLIVLSVFLLLLILLFQVLVQDRRAESIEKDIELSARAEAEKVVFLIDALYIAGDGSNTSFYLPSMLAHEVPYTLTVYDEGFVVVDYNSQGYSVALLTKAVNETRLFPGENLIYSRNGVIFFAQ